MVRAQRDINTMTVAGGVSYGDHQEVRDLALATSQDLKYIKVALERIETHMASARIEWTGREAIVLQRIDLLEKKCDIQQGNTEGVLRSAAVVSGILTLVGMFIAIYISLVVR